ncbi:MAG: hypothetical protein SGILL_005331 [Bacillariaceae sp.]
MYLASRYELALFESYQHYKKQQQQQRHQSTTRILGSVIRNGGAAHGNFSDAAAVERNLMPAIGLALQAILQAEQQKPAIDYLRDGVLWAVLQQVAPNLMDEVSPCSSYFNRFCATINMFDQTPLIRIHDVFYKEFQSLVRTKLEELLAKDAERNVLRDSGPSARSNQGNNGSTLNKKRKKRNNKKKRNGKVKASHGVTPLPAIPAESEEDLEDHRNEGVETAQPVPLDFPQNGTLPRDRNRNIITVLGILDDVLEEAFVEVGLPRTPAFQDDREKKKPSRPSEEPIQIAVKKTSISKHEKSEKQPRQQKPSTEANGALANSTPTGVIARPMSFDLEATEQYRNPVSNAPWGVPFSIPNTHFSNRQPERNLAFYPTPDTTLVSPPSFEFQESDMHDPFAIGRNLMLGIDGAVGSEEDDNWGFVNRYQSRDQSILSEFFPNRYDGDEEDDDEKLMAASTAASISSSTYKDTTLVVETEELEEAGSVIKDSPLMQEADESDIESLVVADELPTSDSVEKPNENVSSKDENDGVKHVQVQSASDVSETSGGSKISTPECRSPSPEAPLTPPPTLSPILLSLADLKDLQQGSRSSDDREVLIGTTESPQLPSLPGHGSLPSSPIPPPKNGLTSSWSRDDLRIQAFRDDQRIKQTSRRPPPPQPPRAAETPTYKAVAVKSLARPIASTRGASVDFRVQVTDATLRRQDFARDSCTRSETALDGQREDHHHAWNHEETENYSVTRDETTTITSGVSQRAESEELVAVREERNNFRDMCLTLGAEVAKLKAMLASQQAVAAAPMDFHDAYNNHMVYRPGSFDPNGMQPFFHTMSGMRPGPMSDAGFHRGDHESQVSEDEVYEAVSKAREARVDAVRRMSSSHTIAGSDASIDFNNSNPTLSGNQLSGTMPLYDSLHSHGLQSRLTKDILQFLSATNMQLKKLDGKRKLAVERFSRLVKTIWPRAQVKLYGSYMSGLCVPSSDLDFVVCLPAVHKKDVALAPGVLEGRNAINESSQKVLARELKGESWIDPRSIKLIERTIVPVIKVATKDTRARLIHLDISFDSPEHHGLEANQMVAAILEELPLIRPLMLVLKSFMLDRDLLSAYTGGLSSYCLFLMLARYLQEQQLSTGDSGSLLMGFLDFYGNCFDARATGVSVSRRQYFARTNNFVSNGYQEATPQPIWNTPAHSHQPRVVVNLPTASMRKDFRRHNSFSETGSADGSNLRQHRFPPIPSSTSSTGPPGAPHYAPHNIAAAGTEQHTDMTSSVGHVRPFTFDPLFVEDPLSHSNNVGRNAFRINQVQRAFSDAHRALLASLDWDIQSSADDYPLLKCLLQGEDMVYEL